MLDIVGILNFYLKNQIEELHKNNIRFQMIGDRSKMGSDLQKLVANAENLTKNNDLMNVYLAFSYGGRDEIIRACNKAMQDGESEISEENFAKYLDVSSMPDVDLMIRTSGEIRISNFFIWQSAYSELYFNDKLWPDFTPNDLDDAIEDFNLRERNFGYAREQKTS